MRGGSMATRRRPSGSETRRARAARRLLTGASCAILPALLASCGTFGSGVQIQRDTLEHLPRSPLAVGLVLDAAYRTYTPRDPGTSGARAPAPIGPDLAALTEAYFRHAFRRVDRVDRASKLRGGDDLVVTPAVRGFASRPGALGPTHEIEITLVAELTTADGVGPFEAVGTGIDRREAGTGEADAKTFRAGVDVAAQQALAALVPDVLRVASEHLAAAARP
jgi:hypothetical protein